MVQVGTGIFVCEELDDAEQRDEAVEDSAQYLGHPYSISKVVAKVQDFLAFPDRVIDTMSRSFGISPATAQERLQRAWPPKVGTQPLPAKPSVTTASAASLGIKSSDPLTFFVLGDHGGVKDPNPQNAVAIAMESPDRPRPAFVYSVGDIVYFNGDASEYHPQFYEAYAHLDVPFVGIPGNHDGDTSDDPSRPPLDTFMANFCSSTPALPVGSEEYERDTQTQPYCDWTLLSDQVTIIGLYSNVPSGGHLEPEQVTWLGDELKAAPAGVPIIVALHHPPYSIDAHHGGSNKMGKALDAAFEASGRTPDLVLSGHVHDYQRFTRRLSVGGTKLEPIPTPGREITYVVSGNGGYHNLHKLAPGATAGQELAPGITFEAGDDSNWGFLELTASQGKLSGQYIAVTLDGSTSVGDTFQVG